MVRAVSEAHQAPLRACVRPGAAFVDGVAPTSRYLTTDEAAAYLRFGSPSGLWNLARRVGVRPVRRGRKALWTIPMLDAMVLGGGTDEQDQVPGRVAPSIGRLPRPHLSDRSSVGEAPHAQAEPASNGDAEAGDPGGSPAPR